MAASQIAALSCVRCCLVRIPPLHSRCLVPLLQSSYHTAVRSAAIPQSVLQNSRGQLVPSTTYIRTYVRTKYFVSVHVLLLCCSCSRVGHGMRLTHQQWADAVYLLPYMLSTSHSSVQAFGRHDLLLNWSRSVAISDPQVRVRK